MQPNGAIITLRLQQIDGYTEEDLVRLNEKHRFLTAIYIDYGYGSYRSSLQHTKTLYGDALGLYTYKKQKVPFYRWKVENIEEEYENWTKTPTGYSVPINEPRKIKKNYFR